MGVDLGLDSMVEAVENASDAGTAYDALLNLFKRLASDRNPFGAAAKLTAIPESVPTGAVVRWTGGNSSVPTGWLACEGQSVSRTTYSALFAKIGTTFGGSGSTFDLPDLRRRRTIGRGGSKPAGSQGPGTSLADAGGHETATLTVEQMASHGHSLQLQLNAATPASHDHRTGTRRSASGTTARGIFRRWSSGDATDGTLATAGQHTHRVSGTLASTGQATAVDIASKNVVMTHIIKT